MADVKAHITELSSKLGQHITIDGKTGQFTVDKDTFEKTLPEGITLEQVEKIHEHTTDLIAAGSHLIGELSIPVIKKHKDIDSTSFGFTTTGQNAFSFNFDRQGKFRNPTTGDETIKFGVVNAKFTSTESKNSGQYKAVRDLIASQAKEAYGTK